jgi:hypothetical protein
MHIRPIYLTLLAFVSLAWTYPPSPLIEAVDKAWVNGDDQQVIKLIDSRLQESPDNPLALFLGYYYHILVANDSAPADQYKNKLVKLFAKISETNPDELGDFDKFLEEIFPVEKDKHEPTPEEMIQIREWYRKEMPNEFPGSTLAQMYSKVFASYDDSFRNELMGNMEIFQKKILTIITNIGIDRLRSDIQKVVDGENDGQWGELPQQKWPESIVQINAKKVTVGKNTISFLFWRMASTYDGVTIFYDDAAPQPMVGTIYEDMGNGIYWFHSSL